MWSSVWEALPPPQSSTPRQIAMSECATEPYNPHLLGQAVDEVGNDGGMEGWSGRKRGGMMEWLLNIQHAAESMQRVVGRLHYGHAAGPRPPIFFFLILVTACGQFVGKQLHLSLFSPFCPTLCSFLNLLR